MRARTAPLLLAACLACTFASQVATSRAHAAGVDPANATAVQREQAQLKFIRGKQFLVWKKYDEAVSELRASLEIVASPNTRLLLARCLREQGKLVEAYVEFGRTIVEARELARADTRYAKAGEGANDDRIALEPKLGFITVTVNNASDETKLRVGNEELRRAAWTEAVPVMPGTSDVVVETPGRPTVKQSITIAAGEKKTLTVDAGPTPAMPAAVVTDTPAPPPPKSEPLSLRTYAYIAGGVGAAGFLTFAIFGSMANSAYDDIKSSCHGPCPPSRADDISSGKTKQTIANIGLAVGVVGLGAGVTLFILSSPRKEVDAPAAALVVGPGWLGVRGTM